MTATEPEYLAELVSPQDDYSRMESLLRLYAGTKLEY